jgi:hypothetical protein
VIFPVDPKKRVTTEDQSLLVRRAVVDGAGMYLIQNLPPGDYFLAAVDESALDRWPQAALLETISRRAERISLVLGGAHVAGLRVLR